MPPGPLAELLADLADTLTFRAGLNTATVVAGTTLLGLAAGIVGVFALLRKRSLVTDAVSHATLPGVALAFLAATLLGSDGRSLPVLMLGAAATGTLGAACIHLITRYSRLREDAAIGIVLSVFFGAGVVAMSYIQANAPTNAGGINAFIFGQAAAMQPAEVVVTAAIAAAAIIAAALLYKEFRIVCFNDAFARVTGWPVTALDLTMTGLAVVVTVAGLQAVGIILVVALLIIPPVAARFWTEHLGRLVIVSGLIGALSGYLGSTLSAVLPDKPAGAVIVLVAGAFFLVSFIAAPARGVLASAARRLRLRLHIAGDHLLERAHELQGQLTAADLARVARTRGWSAPFQAFVLFLLRRARRIEPARAGGIALLPAGVERGARVARNHALWEQYLVDHADIAPSHVEWSVDQVEHILSDDIIAQLEARLTDTHTPAATAQP